jgi:nucleolar protein 58
MLLLFETPAGYGIFRINDKKKLESVEDIYSMFQSDNLLDNVNLECFKKFKDTENAVNSLNELQSGELPEDLRKFLKKNIIKKEIKEHLLCYDSNVANLIKSKMDIETESNSKYLEVFRGIRSQLPNLLDGLTEEDFQKGAVGLSHNYYRHKLKFSIDKVDIMVIQAVGLLDDLDKELNNYAMRLREWYGWHFPEVGKILADNLTYAKVILKMGMRTNAKNIEFGTDLLTPEDEAHIKEAAEISMGSEISTEDELNIKELCNQIIFLTEYRQTLTEYLRTRMMTIAPNLTTMVGELVAARLIAHAGSLISLAKMPGSTIQIFGAEKALFRALKTKSQTPKYGLIYHASIVGQANPKIKGKISRSLASKCALCIRVDALGENTEGEIGKKSKKILEARIAQLESGNSGASMKKGNKIEKYVEDKSNKKGQYNTNNEVILTKKKKKRDSSDDDEDEDEKEEKTKKEKKEKEKTKIKEESDDDDSNDESEEVPVKKSHKKKKIKEESDDE